MSALCYLLAVFFPVVFKCCPLGYWYWRNEGDKWNAYEGNVIAYGDDSVDRWAYEEEPESGKNFYCNDTAFGDLNVPDKVCCYQNPSFSSIPTSFTNDWVAGEITCGSGRYFVINSFLHFKAHYWRFETTDTFDVTFDDCDSSFDSTLFLYDNVGNSLMDSYGPTHCDGDDCGSCSSYADYKEVFIYPSLPMGTYYLRMSAYSNDVSGNYQIIISCEPSTPSPSFTPYPSYPTPYPVYYPWVTRYNTTSNSSTSTIGVRVALSVSIVIGIIIAIVFIVYQCSFKRRKDDSSLHFGAPLIEAPVDISQPNINKHHQVIQVQTLYVPPQQEGKQVIVIQPLQPQTVDVEQKMSDISADDGLSVHFDPTQVNAAGLGQTTPGCCAICNYSELCTLCRFRFVYLIYFIAYQTGLLYVTSKLAKDGGLTADEFELYHHIFLGLAAFISFLFCVYLGNLSDINGRKRYLQYTIIIVCIPYLMNVIYPNIWMYLVFLPLIGFVGSTSILTGLMTAFVIDVVPSQFIVYSFALIHSIEGFGGIIATVISWALSHSDTNGRICFVVVLIIFMLSLTFMSCLKESLPLKQRNINPANNEDRNCWKMFVKTIKENNMLYSVSFFYLLILFLLQGIGGLITAKSNVNISDIFGFSEFDPLFVVSIGLFVGKIFNPTILCCVNLCFKDIFSKLLIFMIILMLSIFLMIIMVSMNGNGLIAFISGILLSWSKLLLPCIYVLVSNSTNKLEKGKTFGVLASVEAVCQYTGAIIIISMYNSNFPAIAFIISFIMAILAIGWLWLRIKLAIQYNHNIKNFNNNNDNQQKEIESHDQFKM